MRAGPGGQGEGRFDARGALRFEVGRGQSPCWFRPACPIGSPPSPCSQSHGRSQFASPAPLKPLSSARSTWNKSQTYFFLIQYAFLFLSLKIFPWNATLLSFYLALGIPCVLISAVEDPGESTRRTSKRKTKSKQTSSNLSDSTLVNEY